MSLRTALISIWTKKKDKESFDKNELAAMGPGVQKKAGRSRKVKHGK